MDRGEELKPGFKKTTLMSIKGKRSVNVTSLIKTQATPEDIYTVSIPALNSSQCIVADTLALSFKFSNSNTKSWFLNNLGRLLCDRLSVNVQGVEVYQNTGESMMEVYKDLWRSEEDRDKGDLNCNLLAQNPDANTSDLLNILDIYDLTQLITEPMQLE